VTACHFSRGLSASAAALASARHRVVGRTVGDVYDVNVRVTPKDPGGTDDLVIGVRGDDQAGSG
jgi:hypothetical protein